MQVALCNSAARQHPVTSSILCARSCQCVSVACAACTGCWTGGLGRQGCTESGQTELSTGFEGSWAQVCVSTGSCATARWDVPRPACCASVSCCASTCGCTAPRALRCGSLGACLTLARQRANSQACKDAAFASISQSMTADLELFPAARLGCYTCSCSGQYHPVTAGVCFCM